MTAELSEIRRFTFLATSVTLGALLAYVAPSASAAGGQGYVSYTGGTTYTQDFNTLAYTSGTIQNSNNPLTMVNSEVAGSPTVTYTLPDTVAAPSAAPISYSFSDTTLGAGTAIATALGTDNGMDGWWGTCTVNTATGSNATVANRFGAQDGSTTTGGQISFGGSTETNRALGLLSTATTGVTYMGLALENTGTTTLTSFNLSYTGELWRQQTSQKYLQFSYLVTPTDVTSDITGTTGAGALPTSGTIADNNLNVSFATGSAAANGSNAGPISSTNLSDTITGLNWAPNTTLWLTWATFAGGAASANGGSQGVAIDNLSFSASGGAGASTTPEPVSGAFLALGAIGLLKARRRNK